MMMLFSTTRSTVAPPTMTKDQTKATQFFNVKGVIIQIHPLDYILCSKLNPSKITVTL
jgi:hypothetical protein